MHHKCLLYNIQNKLKKGQSIFNLKYGYEFNLEWKLKRYVFQCLVSGYRVIFNHKPRRLNKISMNILKNDGKNVIFQKKKRIEQLEFLVVCSYFIVTFCV